MLFWDHSNMGGCKGLFSEKGNTFSRKWDLRTCLAEQVSVFSHLDAVAPSSTPPSRAPPSKCMKAQSLSTGGPPTCCAWFGGCARSASKDGSSSTTLRLARAEFHTQGPARRAASLPSQSQIPTGRPQVLGGTTAAL